MKECRIVAHSKNTFALYSKNKRIMKELKCPKCGATFAVDEADYALILNQVKNETFDAEVEKRIAELHKQQEAEQTATILRSEQRFRKRHIKIETLERRFEKLHKAANCAEECAKAIVFHASRLSPQSEAFVNMREAVEEWCGQFAELGSALQKAESRYYAKLSNDGKNCELIEVVPNFKKRGFATPNAYQVEAKLFEIGYYELEGDPYAVSKHVFTDEEIIADIQRLQYDMVSFVKALVNADYFGIWEDAGKIVNELFDTIPNAAITDFQEVHKEVAPQHAL